MLRASFRLTTPIVGMALCMCLLLAAQDKPRETPKFRQTPRFQTEVTEVPVDVTVTDSRGNPALDLKREDFEILEDGTSQQILHFSLEIFSRPSPDSGPTPESTRAEAQAPPADTTTPAPHRTLVIALGRGRHKLFRALPSLIEFVRDKLYPEDQVSVMAYNRATAFTTDRNSIVRVLENYAERREEIEVFLEGRGKTMAAIYGRETMLRPVQSKVDAIFAGAPGSKSVAALASISQPNSAEREGIRQLADRELEELDAAAGGPAPNIDTTSATVGARDIGKGSLDTLQADLLTDASFADFIAERTTSFQDVELLCAAIEYLRFMDGEKQIIFLTDQGLTIAHDVENPGKEGADKTVANLASNARVRIHTIQTGGVGPAVAGGVYDLSGPALIYGTRRPPARFPGSADTAMATGSVTKLADRTGGLAFVREWPDKALEATNRATSASYLLSYQPKNRTLDGKFRRIEVRVKRHGLHVLHRSGYFADRRALPYERKQMMTIVRTSAAYGFDRPMNDVSLSVTCQTDQKGPEQTSYRVTTVINPTSDLFSREADRYRGELAVTYFVLSKDGHPAHQTWDNLQMDPSPETYQRVLKEGFELEKILDIPSAVKEWRLKVVAYDPKNDRLGSQEIKVRR